MIESSFSSKFDIYQVQTWVASSLLPPAQSSGIGSIGQIKPEILSIFKWFQNSFEMLLILLKLCNDKIKIVSNNRVIAGWENVWQIKHKLLSVWILSSLTLMCCSIAWTSSVGNSSSIVKYIEICHDSVCIKIVKIDREKDKNRESESLFAKGF